jgi:hypothetical protein
MDKLTDEELISAIREAGIEESFNDYVARYADKRVTQGIATYKENQGKKDMNDQEKITNLENELSELKGKMSKQSIDTQIKNELKAQNLSEGLIKYLKIEDPSKIAESVADLKSDLLEIKQAEIDEKLKEQGGIPQKGDITGPGSGLETEAREYAKKISQKE